MSINKLRRYSIVQYNEQKKKIGTQNKAKNHFFACMHNQQTKQNDSPVHLSGSLCALLKHTHLSEGWKH